jgi:predicted RNA-binding protein YlqC (UPF0109 family)
VKALIEYLAKSLVAHPDAVRVDENKSDRGLVLELTVAKEDLGRIIGREGRTIKAIRNLLSAAAAKTKTKVALVIQE